MSAALITVRCGLIGAGAELRWSFSGARLAGQVLWPVASLVALVVLRSRRAGTGGVVLGPMILPSLLGMFVVFGLLLAVQSIPPERADGTLLRAKATPHGVSVYLVTKLVTSTTSVVVYLLVVAIPGWFIVGRLNPADISWPTFFCVLLLGLVATQSLGVTLGSLLPNARAAGYIALVVLGLTGISGIFYPLTALPTWLQWIGQVFPLYWLGLGMRAAVLPDAAALVEVAGSWRLAETIGMLAAWAVAGLVIAPLVLRRRAFRDLGSSLRRR